MIQTYKQQGICPLSGRQTSNRKMDCTMKNALFHLQKNTVKT